jgi:predicted  nucleic acid-binding Zn-ribbon protein
MSEELEQRRGYIELDHIVHGLSEVVQKRSDQIQGLMLETAVLKTKIDAESGRISTIEQAVNKLNEKLDLMFGALTKHADQENKDQVKLLWGVVATLVTALGSLLMLLYKG